MFSLKIPINVERDPETGFVPCLACTQCCQYVAIEIDTPESRRDFDNIRWYLYHPGIEVYIDHDDAWNVLFHSRCEHLLPDGKCAVYDNRPLLCREFDERTCEPNTEEPAEKVILRTAGDLDQWMRLTRTDDRLALKEAALTRRRQRRAEAKARAEAERAAKRRATAERKAKRTAGVAPGRAAVGGAAAGSRPSSCTAGDGRNRRNGSGRGTSGGRRGAAGRQRRVPASRRG